ncbi:MAG TPA: glycosyl hydrolase family 79 C-terminal domain-containing protein [Solirubrobacteraceae bacterium]|nr:glycosyl hydrolase family 79 C-terminal domain-containing protein [Solirubrobacteraceae bacterium]
MTSLKVWQDEIVRWRRAQTRIIAALTFCLLGAGIWHAAVTDSDSDSARAAAAPSTDPDPSNLYASVDSGPTGPARPAGFLGLSFEYSALEAYTGADPTAPDPVFVQLLRNLAPGPGQPVILRIGGNSTDTTWWPVKGISRPRGVRYALTPTWLASVRALSTAVPARLIMGVNLAAGRPRVAAAEADAFLSGIGPSYVTAYEVGNEPDVYGVFPWYTSHRIHVFARSPGYNLPAFIGELTRWQATLPDLPLAGPALAELPWLSGIPTLLAADPRLRVVTIHRYALQGCLNNPGSPSYPSIANLLSDRSSTGLTDAIAPFVAAAHAAGAQFRVDELNSAALAGCLGRAGVSNTFASALWMLDTLFNLASIGVDGVNVHSLPGAGYELFTFRQSATGWQAFVHPDYYGMLMFAQAFPAGARLLPVREPAGPVKVWATLGPDGHTRVTLINKDSRPHRIELQLPPSSAAAKLVWLRAPSADATGGVTLGGQSFGAETSTGALGAPQAQPVDQLFGSYAIELPPASAAVLTR